MKREAWASLTTAISSFVCWPYTMPVSRHSCEEPEKNRDGQENQGKFVVFGLFL